MRASLSRILFVGIVGLGIGHAEVVLAASAACPEQVTYWVQTAESVNVPTWKSALFEEAFRCQAAGGLTRPANLEGAAALAWRTLQLQLHSGLTRNALAAFERLPPEVRGRLTDGKALVLPSGEEFPDLRLDLAAAYLVQGDRKAAGELLREIPKPEAESFYGGRWKPRVLWELVARGLEPSEEDPFDLFAEAVSPFRHISLTWLLATARLAEREDYPAMVSFVTGKAARYLALWEAPFTPDFDVPPRVSSAVKELEAEEAALYQSLLRRAETARKLSPTPQPALVSLIAGMVRGQNPKGIELFMLDRAGRRGHVFWSWAQGDQEISLEEKDGQWTAKEVSAWDV